MLALEGVKVLDLTRLGPGPHCTMILGDLGAEVIKIEEPQTDRGRRAERSQGASDALFQSLRVPRPFDALNRNKKSIVLNLKNEHSREVFYKLATGTDVVVEEFRPGVSKRLGVDYDTLRKLNKRVVHCAITGYGQDGPYRSLPGHDINYISIAGALTCIGYPDHPPAIPLNLLADFAGGGMQAAVGILSALLARKKTGRGQFVDISMTDGVICLLAYSLSHYFATGEEVERGESALNGGEPCYNVYETKDGKYISVGCIEPWFYVGLCQALGREDLVQHQSDSKKKVAIFADFRQLFRTKTQEEWFQILSQKDLCGAKVNRFADLPGDPQLIHRNMIVDVDHPTKGKVKQVGVSIKLSETPGAIRCPAPEPGEHTIEILQRLGYSSEEVAALQAERAVE